MHPVHACISLWGACIGLWCNRLMHALTVWDLKFQVCLRYTFTPATLCPTTVLPWTQPISQLYLIPQCSKVVRLSTHFHPLPKFDSRVVAYPLVRSNIRDTNPISSSLALSYKARVEVTDSDKHTSIVNKP